MPHVYFSRNTPPHPMAAKNLVSGVIVANSLDEAKGKLAAMLDGKGFWAADEYDFLDIATVPVDAHGIAIITMIEMK